MVWTICVIVAGFLVKRGCLKLFLVLAISSPRMGLSDFGIFLVNLNFLVNLRLHFWKNLQWISDEKCKTQWYTLKLFTVVVQRVLIVNFNNSNKYTVIINSLWRAIAKSLSGYYWELYLCWIKIFEKMKISSLFVGLSNILNPVYLVFMARRAEDSSNIYPKILDSGIFWTHSTQFSW